MKWKGICLGLSSVCILMVCPTVSEESKIRILSSPSTYHRPENSNITFPCAVLNLGTSVVTWYREEQVLSADSFIVLQDSRLGVKVNVGSGVDLIISKLKKSDRGTYTCAVNSKDEVLKISHNLDINLPPSIHSLHPGSVVTVEIGSTVRLQCKADGHPKPAVYWSRQHNQAFPGESRQLRSQGDTVILKGVKRDFAGEYFCNADNGVGSSPTVESIQLDVLYPPEVSVEKVYHHVPLGESVTLICFVFANPQPKISWYKNTMKLLDGERIVSNHVGNSYKLSIDKLNIQDYGEYSCRAENSLQKDVTQTLQVSGCPAPPTILGDEYSNQKYSYELLWTVQSYYPILQQEAVLLYNHQFNESGSGEEEEEVKRIKLSGGDPPFSYNFKGLKNNGTFRVRVKSKNEFGWGPFSSVFTFYMFPREKLPMEIKESKTVEKNAPLTSDQSPVSHSSLFSSLFSLLFSFLLVFIRF